jgi:glycosyltransferase involved in cell wall biosynthesis/SAM-dependent methyltransferase
VRVLHVIPWLSPRYGGPAILVPQASVALAERGHRVEIATTNANRPGVLEVETGREIEWGGAAATFHPLSRPRSYATSWSMLVDLHRRVSTFDIVHIHYLYRFHGLAAASAARSQGVPYIIQAHGSLDPWHRRQKRWAKDLYHAVIEDSIIRGAAAMLCTSAREERSIRRLGYIIPGWVIPIGIDANELRASGASDFCETRGIDGDAQVVTFLGRISEKKGVPLLVEAFKKTAVAFSRAHLVVAGPDDEGIGRDLVPMIAKAGLADRVSFVGVVDGPAKRTLLQRSEVFVLASADESFGIAVAEAMAVGCPVVVSPEVAIEDVVRASRAGLVAARDSSAIADAVAAILGDPARAAAMGEAGRRAVDERFSWPMVAEQTEAMYEAVVDARRRQAGAWGVRPLPASPAAGGRALKLACPLCRAALPGPMVPDARWLCAACGWTGATTSGIPVLLAQPATAEQDELDHRHSCGHKLAQAAHFDRSGEEAFEIARPHGAPRLYRFLLAEKFRRAVGPIRPHLVGASSLTVCGGSGMDAEFLARAGAVVTTSDLSLGAANRAARRSERYGLGLESIVADVEHLPLADRSVDLVAVHDGLHHLDDPYAGLAEMARVARRWVVVTEPARASVTRLAIRLGLALEREEAGNRVARMEPSEVAAFLEVRGFMVLRAERYAMYYPHHPGVVFNLLGRPVVFPIVRVGWRLANALLGRFGNKMVVVAERDDSAAAETDPPSAPSPLFRVSSPSRRP